MAYSKREPAHVRNARLKAEADEHVKHYNEGPMTKLVPVEETTIVVSYPVSEDEIRKTFARYQSISFDTAEGYEEGRKAIADCRTTRGVIEERRKLLKADSLAYGRKVDSAAKALVEVIEEVELPLKAKKDAVDNAKEIARRAAEDAEREAIRLAEQAKLDEQRVELARIEAEQRVAREAEAARQALERLALDAEKAAQAAERVAFEAEREALRVEREQAEATRRAALPVEPVVVAYVHPLGTAAPATLTGDSVERAAETPPPIDWVSGESQDSARLRGFATALRNLPRPAVDSDTAAAVLEQVEFILSEAVSALESFGEAKEAATAAE